MNEMILREISNAFEVEKDAKNEKAKKGNVIKEIKSIYL